MSYWENCGKSDNWYTPQLVFDALGCRFDMDVAGKLCRAYCVPTVNIIDSHSLVQEWKGFIWMNPPFGGRNGIQPWLEKFLDHGNGISLTPDRTSAPWFQYSWPRADMVMFTPKMKFLREDGSVGMSPSNGTALWAIGSRGREALIAAQKSGLGIIAKPFEVQV